MSEKLLSTRFKYKIEDDDKIRQQCLLNAYILFGFDDLISILKKMSDDKNSDKIDKDIEFVKKEKYNLS
jgi:hypothetical protein